MTTPRPADVPGPNNARNRRNAELRRARRAARKRIAARTRTGCPRPDKAAYDPNDLAENRIQQRALGPGMVTYMCRCGWSHNGHPLNGEAAA